MASNNFINECKNPANANRLGKITIDGTEYNQSNNLSSLELENSIYSNGTIIGNTYTKSLKASLINVDKDTPFVGKKASPSVGVKYSNNTTEYITFDDYTIESLNDEQTKNFTDIIGYDALNELDKPFTYSLGDGAHTVGEYWSNLVSNLGLQTHTSTFTNSTISIPANPFINGESNRIVLSEIGKVSCTFAKVTKVSSTTYIDLVWFDSSIDYEFQTSDYSTLEGSLTRYGPLNSIILGSKNIGGENVVKEDEESIALNGEHQILIDAEYFLFTQELRQQAINAIYDKLDGFQYYDLKLTTPYGKPFLEVGNKIRVHTNEGNTYDTYILSHKFTYNGTFQSEISSPSFTEQEEVVKTTESISTRTRRTEIMVDKANQQITSLVSDVDELSGDYSELTQTVNGLSLTVSSMGETVEDLEDAIELFTVNLSQDNIVIPVATNQKPFVGTTYTINYNAYYKGTGVSPSVSITGSESGVTASYSTTQLKFKVVTSTAIANKDYTYTIAFSYVDGGVTYTTSKKVAIILAMQGEQGIQGETGATGNGISTINYYYKTTTTQTAPSASSITSTTIPTLSETDKYLWQKEVINYTSGSPTTTVSLIGVYGDKGDTGATGETGPAGATGTGVSSITSQFYLSTSKTSQTGGSWVDTPPAWEEGKYLWTRSKIVYTNPSSTVYTTPVVSSEWEAVNYKDEYIVGTQTGETNAWTGNSTLSELKDGQTILYWLPYKNPSGNVTLNLTLADGTTTGAVNCYYSGTTRLTTHYGAGNAIRLIYRKNVSINGSSTLYTGWWGDANYDSNNYDRVRWNNNIKAKSAITAGRMICGDSSGYTQVASNVAFDVNYPLLWAKNAISANALGTENYSAYPSCNLANNHTGESFATFQKIYLKGKLNGNTFTVENVSDETSNGKIFCVAPTTNDEAQGRQFIPVGISYASEVSTTTSSTVYFEGGYITVYDFQDGKLVPLLSPKTYVHTMYSEDGSEFTPAQTVGDISYDLGKKPSRWQGTYVDTFQYDSTTFTDYVWVDTSQYNREELDALSDEQARHTDRLNVLESTSEGLVNTLNSIGGTNLIKDSMYVLNDGSWTVSGSVSSEANTNAIGLYRIKFNSGSLTQTINVKNGTYVLSFKYTKYSSSSTGTFTSNINGYTETFTATRNDYVQVINVTSGTIVITLSGDASNTGYVYDLMLNSGTVPMEWEQNQNETLTDTVKIGRGITVSSNVQNTTTRINADGFRVTSNLDNSEVMYATEKGGGFNELESTSTSRINGVLFIKVGTQTWLTGGDS